jgi:hypothetical protein
MKKYTLPFMCPKYLTENHLWDGEWLEKNNNSFEFDLLNNINKENITWQKDDKKNQ